ncbi:MAG: aspartate/glutamate racemase family protein [Lachnospiraceae bacterium]|nr:aspartate/glutamate racemase family protein [Lachnospiraceae bacterium]
MPKIGIIHATMNAVQPMIDVFNKYAPEVTVVNFVNENMLLRANKIGGADEDGLRTFTKLFFEAVEAEVDGIIIACSIFCPFASLMTAFTKVPVIAVDRPMLEKAVENGNKIGIMATTAPSGPSAKTQIESIASSVGKELKYEMEIVTDAMVALKKGDVTAHNKIIAEGGQRLVDKGCDTIVLTQITMACAADEMKNLEAEILSSPLEGLKKILEMI